jgi:hypothetical protein
MRSKNEVLCAAAGRLAAERSEADKPAKAHKTIFAPNYISTYNLFQNQKSTNSAFYLENTTDNVANFCF